MHTRRLLVHTRRLLMHTLPPPPAAGTIDVTEFFAGALELVEPGQREAMVQATFKVLDSKGSGFLTKDQVGCVWGRQLWLAVRAGMGPWHGCMQ